MMCAHKAGVGVWIGALERTKGAHVSAHFRANRRIAYDPGLAQHDQQHARWLGGMNSVRHGISTIVCGAV
jgi:hypothetical protein